MSQQLRSKGRCRLKRFFVRTASSFLQIGVTVTLTLAIVNLTANAKGPGACDIDPTLYSIDSDGDGVFNGLNDALHILNFQFLGGPPPQVCLADSGGLSGSRRSTRIRA